MADRRRLAPRVVLRRAGPVLVVMALALAGLPGGTLGPLGPVGATRPTLPAPSGPVVSAHASPHPLAHPDMFAPRHPLNVAPLARGAAVDPNVSYTSEPAPMGISDLGVTPNGVAYSYYTPAIVGNSTIHALETSLTGSGARYMTFQLNVEVVLQNGSTTTTYWIQDVASYDTAANYIAYEDNVWNFSAGTGAMDNHSVLGNGSMNIYPTSGLWWYADAAGGSYAGNGVSLSYPADVSNKVVASVVGGVPRVAFEYNDGYGWVTFDNVSFPFAHGWRNLGFYVTGTQYVPRSPGLFYDAEWDFTGASTSGQTDVASNLDMGLSYWNGHNYQAVRSAFNKGQNTGEIMGNVVVAPKTAGGSGLPYAHTYNGSGTPGVLYGPSSVSTLRVTMPAPNGILELNGVATPYVGGVANLTIAPGSYWLTYDDASGALNASANVTLTGGEYRAFDLVPIPRYSLVFEESGLPGSTPWSLTLGSRVLTGSAATLGASVFNGSYAYSVNGVGGYWLGAYSGSVLVQGSGAVVSLSWNLTVYSVEFLALNRPAGLGWTVSANNLTTTSATDTATLSFPNGTYSYTASAGASVLLSPSSGPFTVADGPVQVEISFASAPGTLKGTVAPGAASVVVDGTSVTVLGGAFSVTLVAGSHEVVASLPGYATQYRNVTVPTGGTVTISVALIANPPGATGPSGASSPISSSEILFGAIAATAVVLVAVLALVLRRTGRSR